MSFDDALAQAIPHRHTNRGGFTGERVSSDVVAALDRQGARVAGAELTWITEADAMSRLGDLYVEATEENHRHRTIGGGVQLVPQRPRRRRPLPGWPDP